MASQGAIWGPAALRLLRVAVTKTTKVVRDKIADAAKPVQYQVRAIPIRNGYAGRQPVHRAALLKQQKHGSRWFSNAAVQNVGRAVRRFVTTERNTNNRFDHSRLPSSNTSRRVAQFSGRAPFASSLRPNLTGGALPRTAGGYSLGGGARYFSHTPAAPAQVIQNVTQAMRAFFISGQKIRYDGIGPHGTHQYRVVSGREYDAIRKLATTPRFTPGSFIDFHITPTLTALSPLAAALSCDSQRSGFGDELATVPLSLDTEGFLDILSTDFSRSLKDFALVMSDLRRLSTLGAIPITGEKSGTLRVRFPGVDALTLETLCDDLCIQRGIIGQDAGLDDALGGAIALKFPFAPASEQAISSPGGTLRSLKGNESDEEESSFDEASFVHEAFDYKMADDILWLSEDDGRTSLSPPNSLKRQHTEDYEGLQGIHRFLEACDRAKGRVG